ncbi:hypothetical protein CVT30_38775 [Streptomyces sp. AMCC400023]|nr:hypothetical protein CVT30_38775 [Streptomyces sp. AMCC400023]
MITDLLRALVPRQATFTPSRRPARPLAAPAENPSTSGTRAFGRHTESTLPHARLRSRGRCPHDAAP